MPDIDELKEQISVAESKLKALAMQNMDYNAEIVRLKLAKDKAIEDYDSALKDLERIINAVSIKNAEVDSLTGMIDKQKGELKAFETARASAFSEAAKEKSALIEVISRLRADKSALEDEIASLQTKSFNAGVTINTQNFTIEDNNLRLNKIKSELSSVEQKLFTSDMELSAIKEKIKEKNNELSSLISSSENKLNSLNSEINEKIIEADKIIQRAESKASDIVSDAGKVKVEADALMEKAVKLSKEVSEKESQLNSLRSSLADREQELKLLELKIKELARKKDIDAQIASLSK